MPPSAQTIYVFITGDLFSFLKTRYWNLRDGTSFFLNTDEVNNFSEIYRNDDNFEITVFDVSTFFYIRTLSRIYTPCYFPLKQLRNFVPDSFRDILGETFKLRNFYPLNLHYRG